MKWINCNEAMPPEGKEVLVWVLYQGEVHGTFAETWLDDDGWSMGFAEGFTVTHWMDIEEPSN